MNKFETNNQNLPPQEDPGVEKEVDSNAVFEYILKLANAENIEDDEAIESIKEQLAQSIRSRDFTDMFEELNPDAYSSTTKQLGDKAKERLKAAINKFTEETANQEKQD